VVKKASRKRRGRPARHHDGIGPTAETLAKLRPDPLLALLGAYGDGDGALERSADEIRAVYLAVCGMLMAGVGGRHGYGRARGGRREIPPFLAWAHAETYLPWANGTKRATLEAVIGLVVDRHSIHPDMALPVIHALMDYAGRIKRRSPYRAADSTVVGPREHGHAAES
jgi:hypothetical protein